MSQISFADAEYAGKRKKTRREFFLEDRAAIGPVPQHGGLITDVGLNRPGPRSAPRIL